MAAVSMLTLFSGCKSNNVGTSAADSTASAVTTANTAPTRAEKVDYSVPTPALQAISVPAGMDVSAVTPGDPNFTPGTKYKGPALGVRSDGEDFTEGMWVWDIRIIISKDPHTAMDCDTLIDMLIQNHVSEIYLGMEYYMDLQSQIDNDGVLKDGYVSEMQLRGFVKKLAKYGIKVSMLTTMEKSSCLTKWAKSSNPDEEYSSVKAQVQMIAGINSRAGSDDEKLVGLHIDMEPEWTKNPGIVTNCQNCADFLIKIKKYSEAYSVQMQYDIMAFLSDNYKAYDEQGNSVSILDIFTRYCDELCIMAYRHDSSGQFTAAKNEIDDAAKNNCRIIVGAETADPSTLDSSEKSITYFTSGVAEMNKQQQALRAMIEKAGPQKCGIAIHWSDSFYQMATTNP